MGVEARDLQLLLELVEAVHGARDPRRFRAAVLPAVRTLVPCAYAEYNEIDHRGGPAYALIDPETTVFEDGGATLASLASQNPLITHFAKTRDGRALQIADFM